LTNASLSSTSRQQYLSQQYPFPPLETGPSDTVEASIPIPLVGAVVGGVVGAACGGFHANSMIRGAAITHFSDRIARDRNHDDLVYQVLIYET